MATIAWRFASSSGLVAPWERSCWRSLTRYDSTWFIATIDSDACCAAAIGKVPHKVCAFGAGSPLAERPDSSLDPGPDLVDDDVDGLRLDTRHLGEVGGDPPLDLRGDAGNRRTPVDGDVQLDPHAVLDFEHAHALVSVQRALHKSAHAFHFARRVGRVARQDVARDRRHYG